MDVSLLQTKLYVPRPQADRFPRPRLLERLDQPRLLTLVAAWTSTRPARVAWLSLNAADDDPGRFWTYVVAALLAAQQAKPQTVHPALGDDYPLITSRAAEPRRVGAETLIEPLSERKLQVLRLLAKGKTNHEIGDALFIAIGTAKKHLSNIFGKLGTQSRTECAAGVHELGLP